MSIRLTIIIVSYIYLIHWVGLGTVQMSKLCTSLYSSLDAAPLQSRHMIYFIPVNGIRCTWVLGLISNCRIIAKYMQVEGSILHWYIHQLLLTSNRSVMCIQQIHCRCFYCHVQVSQYNSSHYRHIPSQNLVRNKTHLYNNNYKTFTYITITYSSTSVCTVIYSRLFIIRHSAAV